MAQYERLPLRSLHSASVVQPPQSSPSIRLAQRVTNELFGKQNPPSQAFAGILSSQEF